MAVTLNSTGITFSNGTSQATAGITIDTNTAASATAYAIGTNLFYMKTSVPGAGPLLNSTVTPRRSTNSDFQTGVYDAFSGSGNTALSGTWRVRGGFSAATNFTQPSFQRSNQQTSFLSGFLALIQRTA